MSDDEVRLELAKGSRRAKAIAHEMKLLATSRVNRTATDPLDACR